MSRPVHRAEKNRGTLRKSDPPPSKPEHCVNRSKANIPQIVLILGKIKTLRICILRIFLSYWRREGDSNPRYGFTPYDDLANRCLQPLGHLSKSLEGIISNAPPTVNEDECGPSPAGAPIDLCENMTNCQHLCIAHILAYMCAWRWRATTNHGASDARPRRLRRRVDAEA